MQATLLGVSIAIILALVTALVGPLFVDWNQYRSVFEAEASRLVGMPVHVTGTIDARILPSPSVVLRGIAVGPAGNAPRLKARELGIEFALGPLVRGALRAVEVRLVGPDLTLGLDGNGGIDWHSGQAGIDPDQLSIERLAIEDGRVVLSDARSGAHAVLDKLWFNGEVRSLAGPAKGEGGFSADGERYFYRASAGRLAEDGTVKLKLALDPSERALTVEADGALRVETEPGFEGTLVLARPAGIAPTNGRGVAAVPWRATGRVKATAVNALFEQIDFQYGPEDRAIKLTGIVDVRFGKSPRLDGILSAREVDLDRAFDLPEPTRRLPLTAIRTFTEAVGDAFKLPFPARLGISLDSATLAGGTVQAVRGDLKTDAAGLDLETFEFRAPGATQVRASGRLDFAGKDATFKGPVAVEANDPKTLLAWLEGRSDAPRDQVASLRASGEVALGANRIAIERLKAEIDRKAVEGRLLYAGASQGRPPRLEAELKAAELDLDRGIAFARAALAGTTLDLPGETSLAIEIGRATIAGVEARNADVKLRLDAKGLVLERVALGDLGGARLNLGGQFENPFTAPHGTVMLDVDARSLEGSLALVAKFAPDAADAARRLAPRLLPLRMHATLSLAADRGAAGPSKFAIDATAGPARLRLAAEASGDPLAIAALDVGLDGEVAADDGGALVGLLGLERVVAVDQRPGRLSFTGRGPLAGELRVDSRLTAGGLAAAATGTVRLFGVDAPSGGLDLALSAADAMPMLRDVAAQPDRKLSIALKTRLKAARSTLALDDLSGTVAGTAVRGRLDVALDSPVKIDGRLDADAVDPAILIAAVIGGPGLAGERAETTALSLQPFAPGLFGVARGRLGLSAARATLTPVLVARQLRASLRMDGAEIALEDIEGDLAAGRFAGEIAFRRVGDGVAVHGRVVLTDVDAAAIMPSDARPAVTGRLALQVEADGTGLSPATLVGSLAGTGTATLTDGEIAGFDPRAFDVVIRAVDQGSAIDAAKIRDIVAAALDHSVLRVPRADGAFTIAAGQARLGTTIMRGTGADLSATGYIDFVERLIDARLTFSGPAAEASSAGRPDVHVALKGPVAAPRRAIDVTALAAWLTLRSVDRETKRIDAIEANARESPLGSTSQPAAAPGAEIAPARPMQPVPRLVPPDRGAGQRPIAAPGRPEASIAPSPERAPALPPPIELRPAPGSTGTATRPGPRALGSTNAPVVRRGPPPRGPADALPTAPGRPILDQLFGPQR